MGLKRRNRYGLTVLRTNIQADRQTDGQTSETKLLSKIKKTGEPIDRSVDGSEKEENETPFLFPPFLVR